MSLDIAILDHKGFPSKQVSIGVEGHFQLMELAREGGNDLLFRMKDYYEDTEIEPSEVKDFLQEVATVRSSLSDREPLFSYSCQLSLSWVLLLNLRVKGSP